MKISGRFKGKEEKVCKICGEHYEKSVKISNKKQSTEIGPGCPVCGPILFKALRTEKGLTAIKKIVKTYSKEHPEEVKLLKENQEHGRKKKVTTEKEV